MRILGKAVSPKTESLIVKLENSFNYPVEYLPISDRPNGRGNSAGSVDIYHQTGKYRVWLATDLPQGAFEADILHELHHVTQGESGYPNAFNKNSTDFCSADRSFVQGLGSHIGSVVLDIDVNHWLSENGYSYSFFTSNNYQVLLHNQQPFTTLSDPLNFAELCLALVHASLYVDDFDAATLLQRYAQYANVNETVSLLRKELLSFSRFTPQTATDAMGFVIDTLKLWKWYYILSPAINIRTSKEYSAFRDRNIAQIVFIPLKLSRQPVSGGKGIYLGEEEMDTISVQKNSLTAKATFAVKVSGNSMKPQFNDGDILLIDGRPDLNLGEIGVFTLNGEGYIKQLGNNELISLDSSFSPIPMNSSIRCNGHVIGKLQAEWIQEEYGQKESST